MLRAAWQGVPEPTQLLVEGMLMKLLPQPPDGTLRTNENESDNEKTNDVKME